MSPLQMLLPGKNKDAMRLVEWVEHGMTLLTVQASIRLCKLQLQYHALGQSHAAMMTTYDARKCVGVGLHDAVEKGYLESMTFGLSRDKEQTDLVEQFQYKFAYDEADGMTMADSFGTDVVIPLSQSSQVSHSTAL